ncbi:MAG: betI 12 [Frankiales bacterium]|nr:betI 12 [Frankiales bacterium]
MAHGDDANDRQRAMSAARSVVSRSGVHGLKLQNVLRESGLSTRAFYRHFEDKPALLKALMEEHYALLAERTAAAVATEQEPLQALSRWLDVMLDVDPDRSAHEAAFTWHWQEVRQAYPQGVVDLVALLLPPLVEVLRRLQQDGHPHVRPGRDASAVILLTRSVLQQLTAVPPALRPEEARELVWDFTVRALTLRPAGSTDQAGDQAGTK